MRTLLPTPLRSLATAFFLISSVHAADWIRVRSTDVELLTDTTEKTARQTLERFAQIRALLPDNATASVPLRIYLFASEREYRAYAPAPTASGFYQSGFDHDSIAMHGGPGLARSAVHEFVHFALNARGPVRPAWMEEGLAEYYSNAEFMRDGVRLGSPIPEHVKTLKDVNWLSAEELQVHHQEPIFYAQSWALVHMLLRARAFTKTVTDSTLRELRGYTRTMKAEVVEIPPVANLRLEVERMSTLDALLARGELALRTGHLTAARDLYMQAERQFPESALVVAGLAALAQSEGDRERAKVLFERSLKMGDRDARAWFQYAMVTGDERALQRAVELNPDLGEAQLLLGVHATDGGDIDAALDRLRRATQLLPRKSYAWYSLAFAQHKAGDVNAAHDSVERALQVASTAEQIAMAEALLTLLQEQVVLGN